MNKDLTRVDVRKTYSRSRRFFGSLISWWRNYRKSTTGVIGLIIVILLVIITLSAPLTAPMDPALRTPDFFAGPSLKHLLGTDSQGRDVASQLIYAGRISLFIGIVVATTITIIGTTLGLLAGYLGGLVDEILMRITDVILILPRLPLMIIIAAYLGSGMGMIILIMTVLGWSSTARQVRALTLSTKEFSFIESAKSIGASKRHIITTHILPNVAGVITANFVMEIVTAILMEAGLSWLGLGDAYHISWGQMLYLSQREGAFTNGAWWWWLPPGICISLLGAAFSFIGAAINDRFVLRLRPMKIWSKKKINEEIMRQRSKAEVT